MSGRRAKKSHRRCSFTNRDHRLRSLKILYVTSHWPGAPPYGAQQRTLQIGRLLQQLGEVSLLLVNTEADGERWRAQTEAEFEIARVLKVERAPRRGIIGRLRHEFDPGYLQTGPLTAALNERQAILELLARHDAAWIYNIHTANLTGIDRWPRTVLDIDDIPSRFHQSSALATASPARRLLDHRMSLIWRRRERRLADRFDSLLVTSEDDRCYLGIKGLRVLPNGFERLLSVERRPAQPPYIGFIGTFKWEPNVDGVRWFCRQIWPLIKLDRPDAQLRVVGEDTEVASQWGQDVFGLGRIVDAGSEIAAWSAMVVPIRVGGGTRIKILEAFARRCPVVATRLGAFGYDLRDGDELFLADEPKVFASRCVELLRSPKVGEAMAERAHHRFLSRWTWESYGDIVRAAVREASSKSLR